MVAGARPRLSSLTVGLIGGLIWGLSAALSGGFSGRSAGWMGGLITGLSGGVKIGLIAGLFVGFYCGGAAVIKHYGLRLVLWLTGYTPFKFVKFLDHCAKLILLKKVGGGYIFIHRMLLEYFADMTTPPARAEDRTTK